MGFARIVLDQVTLVLCTDYHGFTQSGIDCIIGGWWNTDMTTSIVTGIYEGIFNVWSQIYVADFHVGSRLNISDSQHWIIMITPQQ